MNSIVVFVASYLYFLSVALFVGYFFVTKKWREFVSFSLSVLVVSYLLSFAAGHLFYDPRPFVVSHIAPLIPHAPDNGFPSDHALLTGTLAAIATVFNIPLGIALWIIAVLVGAARVFAHVHHTIDVVGSFVIAAVSSLAVWVIFNHPRDSMK